MTDRHIITTQVSDEVWRAVKIAGIENDLSTKRYVLKVLCKELKIDFDGSDGRHKSVRKRRSKKSVEPVEEGEGTVEP